MRTTTFLVSIEAVANASESRIQEAVLNYMRQSLISTPGIYLTRTEDGQSVRVRAIALAGDVK